MKRASFFFNLLIVPIFGFSQQKDDIYSFLSVDPLRIGVAISTLDRAQFEISIPPDISSVKKQFFPIKITHQLSVISSIKFRHLFLNVDSNNRIQSVVIPLVTDSDLDSSLSEKFGKAIMKLNFINSEGLKWQIYDTYLLLLKNVDMKYAVICDGIFLHFAVPVTSYNK
jgi:hypothetical protein